MRAIDNYIADGKPQWQGYETHNSSTRRLEISEIKPTLSRLTLLTNAISTAES